MKNLKYKDYEAKVELDTRDDILVGRVLGVRDIISFHGETVAELKEDFEAALEHYLAVCAKSPRTHHQPKKSSYPANLSA